MHMIDKKKTLRLPVSFCADYLKVIIAVNFKSTQPLLQKHTDFKNMEIHKQDTVHRAWLKISSSLDNFTQFLPLQFYRIRMKRDGEAEEVVSLACFHPDLLFGKAMALNYSPFLPYR